MKKLHLISKNESNEVSYNLKDIIKISYELAVNIYNESELEGNNIKPLEVVMIIDFRNGEIATFSALNWFIIFE